MKVERTRQRELERREQKMEEEWQGEREENNR